MSWFRKKTPEIPPAQPAPAPGGRYGSSSPAPSNDTRDSGFASQSSGSGGGYRSRLNPDSARKDLFADAKPPSSNFGAGWDKDPSQMGNQSEHQDEDDEVDAIKQQMRFAKQESVASTRNALRIAREAEMTATATLSKLGEQSERIANTERSLDLAKAHNQRAEDEAKEIKALNKSIFRPTFTVNKQGKRDAEEARIMNRHVEEKSEREKNRKELEDSKRRVGGALQDAGSGSGSKYGSSYGAKKGRNLEERSRYQFESTASDDEVENEIDDNLDEISGLAGRLNILAKAQGSEVDAQNKKLARIADKTDVLDNAVVRNTERLKRIK